MLCPLTLTSLTPREAIADALYRAIIGFDRNDIPFFNSAFAGEKVTFAIKGDDSRTAHDLSTVRNTTLAHVGPMDTTHMISNIRIDVQDEADTASLTCYALAQHFSVGKGQEPGSPQLLVAGEYAVDLVKDEDDGLWKIKKWISDVIWRQGDRSVMVPQAHPAE